LAALAPAFEVFIKLIVVRLAGSFCDRNRPLSVKQATIFLCLSVWVLVTLFSQITVKVRHLCSARELIYPLLPTRLGLTYLSAQ
jgi:hypothetical protein